ncbi:peptidylprolyl isomerase [Planctomycetota bacterium]
MASPYSQKIATVETTLGTFKLLFYPEKAPLHVENFVKLAESGYYDGTTFHRIVPGFMIQGGDPEGTGMGGHSWKGPGQTLQAELSDMLHVAGTLSMARTNDPNSAGSQFFICLGRQTFLDGQYTVFGQTIEGWEVVRRMGHLKTGEGDRPLQPVTITRVALEDL